MDIQIRTNDITAFTGDAIIVPCDSELSYTKSFSPNSKYPLFKHESEKSLVKQIFEKGGKELVREITTIGFCEIGYAVSVQAYDLKAKRLIFMPVADHNNEVARINYIALHQALRAAFTLAELYKAKSVAIAGIHIPSKKRNFFLSLWNKYFGENNGTKPLSSDEVEDIIISIAKNFDSFIKEVSIFKYSK